MESKMMDPLNWMVLFVVLMLVPGSTLNVIESTAATRAKPITSKATITTPPAMTAMKSRREKDFTAGAQTSQTSHNSTHAYEIHSISSTSSTGIGVTEPEITAKSSIMEFVRVDGMGVAMTAESVSPGDYFNATEAPVAVAGLRFATEIATMKSKETITTTSHADFGKVKLAKATATVRSLSGSLTQPTAEVDVTTKRTLGSLNRTQIADKVSHIHNAVGEVGSEGEGDGADGNGFTSKVVKATIPAVVTASIMSQATITTNTIATTTTTPETPKVETKDINSAQSYDVTTPDAFTAAATTKTTTQPLAVTHLASTPSNEFSLQHNYRQTNAKGNYTFLLVSSRNNNNSSSELQEREIGNNNSDVFAAGEDVGIIYQQRRRLQKQQQQQQMHPLQRPKVQKNDNNNNQPSYSYNSNNNYFSNQQNARGGNVMEVQKEKQQQQHALEVQRPQFARQVQQQEQDQLNYHLTVITPSGTTAAFRPAIDNNLINDKLFKQSEANLNKSIGTKYKQYTQKAEQTNSPSADNAPLSTTMNTHSALSAAAIGADDGKLFGEQSTQNTTKNVSAFPTVSTTTIKSTTRRPPPTTTPRPTPTIDDFVTVISQAGTHAYLPCNVKQLVKKPISWLRMRDGHILTVDQTTFIADQRFQSIFAQNPERWSLQIKYVQLKDEGTYECQVSTEPKSSAIVTLRVIEPRTELIGEPTRHVKAGSQVKLRCIISQALEPPHFINWFHNQKQIYLHSRRGWRTEIERIELPLTEAPTTPATTTTTTLTTPATTTTTTTTPTTVEMEEATTFVAQTDAAAASATSATSPSTTKGPSLANGFDSYGDTLKRDTTGDIPSPATPVNGKGITLPTKTTTTTTPTPTMSLINTSLVSVTATVPLGLVGSENGTSSLLAAVTAATAVSVSTTAALPATTIPTKTMRWPTTTTATIGTTLAAVEVRQITTASLIIPAVEKQDSGNYTCSPSNSAPKTFVLHVLNGEYSASAITSGVGGHINTSAFGKRLCALIPILLQAWHHKLFAYFIISIKVMLTLLLRCTLNRARRATHFNSVDITAAPRDNVATAIHVQPTDSRCNSQMNGGNVCSFCSVQRRKSASRDLGDSNRSQDGKYIESRVPLIARIASNARPDGNRDSDTNCRDKCRRRVGWRAENARHLPATEEKT